MNKTHKQMYPEQYSHPLCGKRVTVEGTDKAFTVERVVSSMWGELVVDPADHKQAYSVESVNVATA